MSKQFDVDYFIKKFEAIPEGAWTVGTFLSDGKSCALGHCGYRLGCTDTKEGSALVKLFWEYGITVVSVNDGEPFFRRFKQATPRQRILAALYYIKDLKQ